MPCVIVDTAPRLYVAAVAAVAGCCWLLLLLLLLLLLFRGVTSFERQGLSVLRELDLDLYKQGIHGTSLAGGADGCCIPARA